MEADARTTDRIVAMWRDDKSIGQIASALNMTLVDVYDVIVSTGEFHRSIEANLKADRESGIDGPVEEMDWRDRDPDAPGYDVIDADTGEVIPDLIWRANAREGWYDHYPPGPDGVPQIDPGNPGRVLSDRVRRDIKIVPRSDEARP